MQYLDISTVIKLVSRTNLSDEKFAIDVAMIGLRFLHHIEHLLTHNFIQVSDSSHHSLDQFYKQCEQSLTEFIHASHTESVLTIDATSMILSMLCIKNSDIRDRTFADYFDILQTVKNTGVNPIPEHREAILHALLTTLDGSITNASTAAASLQLQQPKPELNHTPQSAIDLLEWVLVSTDFGTHPIQHSQQQLLVQLAKPMAMYAVRDNDIAGVSAIILATELSGYANYLEADYVQWLLRQRREDGLLGNWALEGESTPCALLLNTMFGYWALSMVMLDPINKPSRLYPGLKHLHSVTNNEAPDFQQSCQVSAKETQRKCLNICHWLDNNIHRFSIDIDQQNKMEMTDRIKPAVEMFLTTYLIQKTFQHEPKNPLYRWARRRSEYLYDLMPWPAMIEYFRINLSTSLGLLLFPLAAISSGKPIPYERDIKNILANQYSLAQERPPMRKMDFCFLTRLMNMNLPQAPNLASQFSDTLLAKNIHPLWFSISSLYDITHTIFYGTDFGQQHTVVTEQSMQWNQRHLYHLAIDSMLRGDLDLGGEFILCCFYTGTIEENTFDFICRAFLDNVPDTGPVQGPDLHLRPHLDEFDACYHTCLVTIAALAEIWHLASNAEAEADNNYITQWDELSSSTQQQPCPITDNAFSPQEAAEKLLNTTIDSIQDITSRQDKQTFLVTDKQARRYVLSRYSNHLDYLNVRETSKVYQQAVSKQLAVGDIIIQPTDEHQQGFVTLKDYVPGDNIYLSQGKQDFAMLGAFAYHFHEKLAVQADYCLRNLLAEWMLAMNSEVCAEIPVSILNTIATANTAGSSIIHGDLNATNIILNQACMDIYAIDFDNLGIGLPEQELALALLYENRGEAFFKDSKQQLISAYQAEGGSIDTNLLNAFIVTAPVYVFNCEMKKQGQTPGMLMMDKCRSQIQDRLKLCYST